MPITKAKKQEILKGLTESLESATSAVFVRFNTLTVAEVNELRAKLKAEGVKYIVAKKTLIGLALKNVGVKGDAPELPGEVALAYFPKDKGNDATTPARALNEFVKKFKDKLMFLGGVIGAEFAPKETIIALAAIPPTPVLRGMFVNIINSPIQRFAVVLGQVVTKKV